DTYQGDSSSPLAIDEKLGGIVSLGDLVLQHPTTLLKFTPKCRLIEIGYVPSLESKLVFMYHRDVENPNENI
ncbi:hypothetical protein V1478_017563, partial [Vespula squamosa]